MKGVNCKMFRCPYCGKKTFILIQKLGINTTFLSLPSCQYCKRSAFRNFVIGGYLTYYLIFYLALSCTFLGVSISVKLGFYQGVLLVPALYIAFYLTYHYYFCYFGRGYMYNGGPHEKIMNIQIKEMDKFWPKIRKGEIYELIPAGSRESFGEGTYTIGMVEKIKDGKVSLRIISAPTKDEFTIKDKLLILCGETQYSANVI